MSDLLFNETRAYEKGIPINYFFVYLPGGRGRGREHTRILELQITSTAQISVAEEATLVSYACHFNAGSSITGQIDRFQTTMCNTSVFTFSFFFFFLRNIYGPFVPTCGRFVW